MINSWDAEVFKLKSHGFGAMRLKEIIKNKPCATKIKNITPVVYLEECLLKVGDSGNFSS